MLFWASLCISYSNAQQIDSTGNLVNFTNQTNDITSTWQNAGTIGQPLTCWAGGDPGYCGPLPRVAANGGNSINFSYGLTDLYQIVSIKNALPNLGTGLQVNGFNFGFTAKNGNGWDNGQQDYLTAYVKFYDNTNSKVLENYTYNQNGRYNWTTFNYSETFKNPYAVPNIGNAQYGFIGKDNNNWVGPYGPEISSVNFSLKYSVDQCANNQLFSPSCAGYLDALSKITAPVSTVAANDYSQPPPPGAPPPEGAPPPPGSQPPPPGQNGSPPPPGAPPPQGSAQAQAGSPSPVAATQQERSASAGPGLGFALNLIAKNSEREKAIAQQAISTSIAEAQSAGDKAQAIGTSTASAAVAMSTSSAETAFSGNGIQVTSSVSRSGTITSIGSQISSSFVLQSIQGLSSATTSTQSASTQLQAPTSIEFLQSTQNFGLFELQVQRQLEPEVALQVTNFMTDRNNPLREIITPATLPQAQQEQQTTNSVNRNPQANEVAVGVALEKMSVAPLGYANYTNFALKDANFYVSKDIYPKQTTVDNVRAMRQLSSERLHQQMVQDQYR